MITTEETIVEGTKSPDVLYLFLYIDMSGECIVCPDGCCCDVDMYVRVLGCEVCVELCHRHCTHSRK